MNILTANQQAAVESINGPIMIIAGAGAGKTLTLMKRLSYMLRTGIKPENIIVLTFTNKAAQEMKARLENEVSNQDTTGLWIGTFHSIFARILRTESATIGFRSDFTINDTKDTESLIKQIVKELELNLEVYKPKDLQKKISKLKNQLIPFNIYKQKVDLLENDEKASIPEFAKIYEKYSLKCHFSSIMDFDDLLLQTNILLKNDKILAKYHEIFHYIMVDEYQDTNISQFYILKKLAQKKENICVVGDDAQSIYGFRGANINNILNFENTYPNTKKIFLDRNFRSTQLIVECSNSVISNNKKQIVKKIYSEKNIGNKIKLFAASSEREEAKLVANEIIKLESFYSSDYSDCCILYRNNNLAFNFEAYLLEKQIPYKIYAGYSFFQKKEIKDFFAYLKICLNPSDDASLIRIFDFPKKGIGETAIDKIQKTAIEKKISLWRASSEADLPKKQKETIQKLKENIKIFWEKSKKLDCFSLAKEILEYSEIAQKVEKKQIENLNQILESIKQFSESNSENTLSSYMSQAALLTTEELQQDIEPNRVTLMTIHAAKGLEFKNVFIVGLEQGIFPSEFNNSTVNIEEERRAFYVGITRAKERLYFSYAQKRRLFDKIATTQPSQFLSEIDKSYFEN